tara:strand:+ start:31514 stop:32056 length:543 start_codon:yes stop_codon:yes gene_type:complete
MMDLHLTVEDERWLDKEYVNQCASAALKVAQKWLTKESIRRIGEELNISRRSISRRVKAGKVKDGKTSMWYGLLPINIAFINDSKQVDGGVVANNYLYNRVFFQSMKNSPILAWRRVRERAKQPKPRRKPLPKGQRRKRKSPPVERVSDHVEIDMEREILQLEAEIQDVYREAFLDELHQ